MPDLELGAALPKRLAKRNNFEMPSDDLGFFGRRGMLPVNLAGTPFQDSHVLRSADIGNIRMRGTPGQSCTLEESAAVFPRSTGQQGTTPDHRLRNLPTSGRAAGMARPRACE